MDQSGDIMALGAQAPQSAAPQRDKPTLFLHIPKTAGTSFLLTLQNVFGDARVKRFATVDAETKGAVDALIENDLASISCLTGHLPLWMFNGKLDRFRPFTVLREPISRVLSLFRFLKAGDPQTLRRLGLRPDTNLTEFLASRHPEIYAQIRNGMVRMLCGDRRMLDFDSPEFWDESAEAAALDQALAHLTAMDFGLADQMGRTLQLARAVWGAPYPLRETRENTTRPGEDAATVEDLRAIILMNVRDLALYKKAEALFAERSASPGERKASPLAVFSPPLGRAISIANIPGRQGFHEFERDGFAWLREGAPAEVHFTLRAPEARLKMLIYCVTQDYPADEIIVRINGERREVQFTGSDPRWGWLETAPFPVLAGVNRLEIEAPLFVPAASVAPESMDRRRLGMAVANVEIGL